ncbi:Hydroxyacid oxidase 1 [Araneus ventricosus]|uniref:(S)-2-hydroxy-acid oxidase n=1 Tax=Araneus ventricosus TaxID=182803 RepID=A0A4Y2DH22_ARAVE|nr:Hydroxyacid oxidase 1 [Araneus ventricosus]
MVGFIIWLLVCCSILQVAVGYIPRDSLIQRKTWFFKRLGTPYMKTLRDYEEYATAYMDRHARDYYASGAEDEITLRDNEKAFQKYHIRPRLLRNVAHRNMSLTMLGQPVGIPLGISPVAFQKMAHPDGEVGTARALANHGGVMILSMLSTTALEDLSRKTPPGSVHWLQIYITKDREVTRELIHRADIAGYKAIVVTADSPVNGMWGINMVHNLTLPSHLKLPNLLAKGEVEVSGSNLRSKVGFSLLDPSLTWKDIQWIQTFTALPIVVKGVLTAEDAILAVEHGASGILVSNHGGRQLDGVPATLDVLPEIVRAVKGRAEVYLDGGVRKGGDVFKALALGAKAVFFGRPAIWGLVHSGQDGVDNVLKIVKSQLDTTMALTGASRLDDIQRSHVMKDDAYDSHAAETTNE